MFQMCGVFAEFESSIIRERIVAGQNRARESGKHIGRRSKIDDAMRASVIELRQEDLGIRKIAVKLGIGIGTVYKILAQCGSESLTQN